MQRRVVVRGSRVSLCSVELEKGSFKVDSLVEDLGSSSVTR